MIRLRALEPSDAVTIYRWENDFNAQSVSTVNAPLSLLQITEYINTYDANPFASGQLRLIIETVDTAVAVGTIDLFDIDAVNKHCAIGLLIAPEHRGLGYGAEAVAALEQYASSKLGLHMLWCVIAHDNMSCRSIFDRRGFCISGRLRSWIRRGISYCDAFLYQKFL